MIQYIILIPIFLSGFLRADDVVYHISNDMKGSYGINIKEVRSKADDESLLEIYQNNTLISSYKNHRFSEIYSGDLNGDGFEEMVFQGFSGGRHCCFDIIIAKIRPNIPKPLMIDTANTEYISVQDIDNDKQTEIITYDDQYSNIFGLSFASSPLVKVILHFDGDKLLLCPKLMKKYIHAIVFKHQKFHVSLDQFGNISISSDNIAPLLSEMLRLWYMGENEQAIKLMQKYLVFEHRAVLKLFLMELVEGLHNSPYWDDIRRVNHWQEETACFTDRCIPPEELFEDWQVVDKLFEMHEKDRE